MPVQQPTRLASNPTKPSLLVNLILVAQAVPSTHGKLYYTYNDHLGTPQALTDEAGTVIWLGNNRQTT